MNNPCDRALHCDCAPTPFRNFSAEAPDPADFFAMSFFMGSPPLNAPPAYWTIPGSALGTCESIVSLQDAQDCANRHAESKVLDTWVDHGVPVRQFGNVEQNCQLPCDVGDPFTYTIAAGTVIATSQAEADTLAASICLYRANLAKVCSAVPTIEAIGLDNAYDMAVNAKVVVGNLTGQAAYYKNGGAHLVTLIPGTVISGNAFAVDATGNLMTGDMQVGGDDHGFWYKQSTDEIRDLPTLLGFYSNGEDITSDGYVFTPGNGVYNPNTNSYIATATVPTPKLPITPKIMVNGVHTWLAANGISRKFFRCSPAVATDITPAGSPFGSFNNVPIAINELGHVAGQYETGFGAFRTFYNPGGGVGASVDIGNFGGFVTGYAMAPGVDYIVGQADNGGGFYTAFIWNPVDGIELLPSFSDITPGATAQATDVNDAGWVVGVMDNQGFVYHDGQIFKLLELLPLGTGWTSIDSALFINNLKQVVGQGTYLGIPGTLYIMQLV